MVFEIAIVEDEVSAAETLEAMIREHRTAKKHTFRIKRYSDAASFLSDNCGKFHVIFFDIQMPGISGIDAARAIRKENESVLIVFVTNLAQYAVEGYEVLAYDFILKPLVESNFAMKFDRICNKMAHKFNDSVITVSTRFGAQRIHTLDIIFIEVVNHDLIIHTSDREYRLRGTISVMEAKLAQHHFVRCNACYLVNLNFVKEFYGDFIVVGNRELKMSQSRKKTFLTEFAKYAGDTV
jgi:DNA-binding LytR/AlgR family response regulator